MADIFDKFQILVKILNAKNIDYAYHLVMD